jgi:hypothetical protein
MGFHFWGSFPTGRAVMAEGHRPRVPRYRWCPRRYGRDIIMREDDEKQDTPRLFFYCTKYIAFQGVHLRRTKETDLNKIKL